jgi:diacylglycerol kinase family enzyme
VEFLRGGHPLVLVVNPAARRATRTLARARATFAAAGVPYEEVRTERPGHAAKLARERSADAAAIVVLGGDGTVMEVAGALAHSGCPVGILPGGTGNLVARSLGIPLDAARAVYAVVTGVPALMDLGRLGDGTRFAFSASVGVDARMIANTTDRAKRRFGVGAYALAAVREGLACRTFRACITVDGEVVERDAAEVMIANIGSILSDLFSLGPGIRYADGRLDLCMYMPATVVQAVGVMWRLWRRRFEAPDRLLFRPGRVFHVECDPPQRVQADGELLGTTPFDVTVDAGAAVFLVPRSRD